eukprot:scaffold22513_cov107-Isochrysis_galbana.AAC.2
MRTISSFNPPLVRPQVELPLLQAWLRELALARHEDVYRIKGVISLRGEARRFITHGVHAQASRRAHCSPTAPRPLCASKPSLSPSLRSPVHSASLNLHTLPGAPQVLGFFGSEWAEGEPRVSSVVLIGHSLPQPQIKREFLECCQRDDGPSDRQAEAAGECVMCPPCEGGVAVGGQEEADAHTLTPRLVRAEGKQTTGC